MRSEPAFGPCRRDSNTYPNYLSVFQLREIKFIYTSIIHINDTVGINFNKRALGSNCRIPFTQFVFNLMYYLENRKFKF